MKEDPLFLDDYLFGNFFDFPMEDLEANDCGAEDLNNLNFQSLETPPWPPFLSGLTDEVPESNSISWNRAPQVKPRPSITDTSSTRNFSLCNNSNDGRDLQLLHASSPVSVLESSSSCSAEKPAPTSKLVFAVKRSRSKRRRPAIVNPFFVLPFFSSTSSTSEEYHPSTASESGSEIQKPARKKQNRKRNLTVLSGSRETNKPYLQQNGAHRKCMHCEVTETPQWREGPMGPKTLCNACGVRYRSGRLLPEYRPAASPAFVPSLHSNSHKKIMEMRNKGGQ